VAAAVEVVVADVEGIRTLAGNGFCYMFYSGLMNI
jgi:hypothetical protein